MYNLWGPVDPVVLLRELLLHKTLRVEITKMRLKKKPNVNKTGYEEDY
jgi:hypothetical protein